MARYVGFFIGCLFLFSSEIYVWSRFLNKKINFKNPLLYVSIIILTFMGMFNYLFVNAFIKVLIVTILMCFCNWLVLRGKLNETITSVIYGQILIAFSDLIFTSFWILVLKKDANYVKDNLFYTFLANVVIALIYVGISYIPFVKRMYSKLVSFTEKFQIKNLIWFCLLIILSTNFLLAIVFYNMNSIYVIIINLTLLSLYSLIVFKSINEKNNNIIMKAQNDYLMESLNEYENMVDRQRVDNHENKNQLLIIKNMIKKKDKDVIKYIDTIVKDEKEDDEALYTRVKNIPSGGLQGIIYQKMLSMKDNKILFSLDVSRDVRKIDLDNIGIENNYKLCKIVGVLLDNSIEESLNVKDKCIMISLYVDDNMLVIDVSNRFGCEIDIDRLDDVGYTTKGDGHGYGLSLVKDLVSKSDIFVNERRIKKDIFKQIIKIKLK
jgi:two-component system sensor histidine kinase AgrC